VNNVASLEDIFTKRLLVIPDYQRGYAWDDQQVNEFIDDLELLGEGRDHYTGTLVVNEGGGLPVRKDAAMTDYQETHVVDGQQRLTTAVLLLDAIRREMGSVEHLQSVADGIATRYVSIRDLNGQPLFKLRLNSDTNDFWINSILADDPALQGATIQSHRRLAQAGEIFSDYLDAQREQRGEGYTSWLQTLYDKVVHRLKFNLYLVEDSAEVGVIFETMNDRGKPLTELEKVKNYLLYLSDKLDLEDHGFPDDVNKTWKNVLERLMAAGLMAHEDQLLRAHWLMAYDYDRKTWEGLGAKAVKALLHLKDYQGAHQRLLADLKKYSSSLDAASLAYCDINAPRRPGAFNAISDPHLREEVASASEKLVRIGALATFLPYLMAARRRFATDPARYLDAVELCERFAFRVYRVLEKQARTAQSSFFKLGFDVYKGYAGHAAALNKIRGWLHSYAPRARVEEELARLADEKKWYYWPGLKYFLYEYEEHLARDDVVQLPWDAVERGKLEQTIEHILPQMPSDPYWRDRFDQDAIERYTHDLGNLCLTSHNSSYGNKPFNKKKGHAGADFYCYAKSNLFQERELTAFHDWGAPEILKRRQRLVEWALDRWDVDEVVDVEPDIEEPLETVGASSGMTNERETPDGHPISRATAREREHLVMTRGTMANPYMIQPYNPAIFKPWQKGAKGSCSWCTQAAVYMAKGVRRWFSMCEQHASRWTGFAYRATEDYVESDVDQEVDDLDTLLDEGPRQRDRWDLDAYVRRGVPTTAVEALGLLTDRLTTVLPAGWSMDWAKYYINVRDDQNQVVITIGISRPHLRLVHATVTPESDPYPHLKGKVGKDGTWRWPIWAVDKVPEDLTPAIELAKDARPPRP
jgi:hypothetical protein